MFADGAGHLRTISRVRHVEQAQQFLGEVDRAHGRQPRRTRLGRVGRLIGECIVEPLRCVITRTAQQLEKGARAVIGGGRRGHVLLFIRVREISGFGRFMEPSRDRAIVWDLALRNA